MIAKEKGKTELEQLLLAGERLFDISHVNFKELEILRVRAREECFPLLNTALADAGERKLRRRVTRQLEKHSGGGEDAQDQNCAPSLHSAMF